MEASKVTSKHQVTIPLKVRKLMGIKQGDAVVYDIKNGEVWLRRATPMDLAYSAVAATLSEWNSRADDDAYRDL